MLNKPDHTSPDWKDRIAAIADLAQTQTGGNRADMLVDLEYALLTVLAVAVGFKKKSFLEGLEILQEQLNEAAAELAEKML